MVRAERNAMYADNTLTPKEAVRLCALGTLLAQGSLRYGPLVDSIRHFVDRMLGPSLDVMGTSIELLKYEGLIEAVDDAGMEDDAELVLTESGREHLRLLLSSNIRVATTELNKLIVALKFRFLHLLNDDDRRSQADILVELCETELARLDDLRQYHSEDQGFLVAWLDHDIELLETRLAWLNGFRASLD